MARSATLSAVHALLMGRHMSQERGLRNGSVNLAKRTMNETNDRKKILLNHRTKLPKPEMHILRLSPR